MDASSVSTTASLSGERAVPPPIPTEDTSGLQMHGMQQPILAPETPNGGIVTPQIGAPAKKVEWSSHDVFALLEVRSREEFKKKFAEHAGKGHMLTNDWELVRGELAKKTGKPFSRLSVRDKWKYLRKEYSRCLQRAEDGGGESAIVWAYYYKLKEILGDSVKPASNPKKKQKLNGPGGSRPGDGGMGPPMTHGVNGLQAGQDKFGDQQQQGQGAGARGQGLLTPQGHPQSPVVNDPHRFSSQDLHALIEIMSSADTKAAFARPASQQRNAAWDAVAQELGSRRGAMFTRMQVRDRWQYMVRRFMELRRREEKGDAVKWGFYPFMKPLFSDHMGTMLVDEVSGRVLAGGNMANMGEAPSSLGIPGNELVNLLRADLEARRHSDELNSKLLQATEALLDRMHQVLDVEKRTET